MDSATSFLEIPSSFLQILTSTSLIIVAVYLPFSHFASRLSTRIRRGWNMREGEGGMSAGHRNNDAKRSWRALRLPKNPRPATRDPLRTTRDPRRATPVVDKTPHGPSLHANVHQRTGPARQSLLPWCGGRGAYFKQCTVQPRGPWRQP